MISPISHVTGTRFHTHRNFHAYMQHDSGLGAFSFLDVMLVVAWCLFVLTLMNIILGVLIAAT